MKTSKAFPIQLAVIAALGLVFMPSAKATDLPDIGTVINGEDVLGEIELFANNGADPVATATLEVPVTDPITSVTIVPVALSPNNDLPNTSGDDLVQLDKIVNYHGGYTTISIPDNDIPVLFLLDCGSSSSPGQTLEVFEISPKITSANTGGDGGDGGNTPPGGGDNPNGNGSGGNTPPGGGNSPGDTPEPSTWALLGLGLAGLALLRRFRAAQMAPKPVRIS